MFPIMSVQGGYFRGTDLEVVGYKVYNIVIIRVVHAYETHIVGIKPA